MDTTRQPDTDQALAAALALIAEVEQNYSIDGEFPPTTVGVSVDTIKALRAALPKASA